MELSLPPYARNEERRKVIGYNFEARNEMLLDH